MGKEDFTVAAEILVVYMREAMFHAPQHLRHRVGKHRRFSVRDREKAGKLTAQQGRQCQKVEIALHNFIL